jgi:hypothetical protein
MDPSVNFGPEFGPDFGPRTGPKKEPKNTLPPLGGVFSAFRLSPDFKLPPFTEDVE